MDEELKKILDENLAISKESLKILKGIRRGNRLAIAFKIFYWLIIIGALAGSYYFLEPYIKQGLGIINQAQQAISGVQKVTGGANNGSPTTSDILKNLENIIKPK